MCSGLICVGTVFHVSDLQYTNHILCLGPRVVEIEFPKIHCYTLMTYGECSSDVGNGPLVLFSMFSSFKDLQKKHTWDGI